jgi:hypothetical protein
MFSRHVASKQSAPTPKKQQMVAKDKAGSKAARKRKPQGTKRRVVVTKKQQKELISMVTKDTTSERRTSRGAPRNGREYPRPMSAVDASKKSGLPLDVVREVLGPRPLVVRRYRQAAAQRLKRKLLKIAEASGSWV